MMSFEEELVAGGDVCSWAEGELVGEIEHRGGLLAQFARVGAPGRRGLG